MPSADALMASVANSDDSAYLLTSDLRILTVNAGFLRFAEANGGGELLDQLGTQSIFAAMSQPLRQFYWTAFTHAQATGLPWQHEYECSSANWFRLFHMTVYPVEFSRLVVVHSRRVESAHRRPAGTPDEARYVRAGFIKMCSHCRRVRNHEGSERWDWVPAYLSRPAHKVSHGLCATCATFYWDDAQLPTQMP